MMTRPRREPAVEERRLAALVEHLLQRAFFDDLPPDDFARLVADIQRHGLREKIHVLPGRNAAGLQPNTILDGHQRRRALTALGETTASVVVRYDLLDADAAAVERAFLTPNQL